MSDADGRLRESPEPLQTAYDTALLDLDGVVYVGGDAIPGVADHLAAAGSQGMRLTYVTNNASRTPTEVAALLERLGIPATPADVVTSAQAAARLLTTLVEPGAPVYVIGGTGLEKALEERGLTPVHDLDAAPAAVVSGYHPDLRWRTVVDGAIAVGQGTPWVAANTDLSVPTPRGPGPGNGVLVRAVADFTGKSPRVAGKPEPGLFQETIRRVGAERPLVIGDRLDTDIAGARRTDLDSLLVMTGVTGLAELVAAEPEQRPTYVAATLAALARPQPLPQRQSDEWQLGGWSAAIDGRRLVVRPRSSPQPRESAQPLASPQPQDSAARDDWWRVVAACAWAAVDESGVLPDVSEARPPA